MVNQNASKKNSRKAKIGKFSIDCSVPVSSQIMTTASVEKYLHDRIKVNGKTGQLGDEVRVSRTPRSVIVSAKMPFSKRYIKYLLKKYLAKQSLREYLRPVATGKLTYALRFYPDGGDDEEEEEV